MIISTAEPWIEAPLRRYVDEARATMALLLHPSGQVLAQAGFHRPVDVASACALAAAAYATAGELGRQLEGRAFLALHPRVPFKDRLWRVTGVFDSQSSLGLVRVFFEDLRGELAAAAPTAPPPVTREPMLSSNFEDELNANLEALFGRGSARRSPGA